MNEQDRVFAFFGVWLALGFGTAIFVRRGSPAAKRTWFPRLEILIGVVFVVTAYSVMPHPQVLYLVVPVASLLTFLNIRATKFCGKCGAYHRSFFLTLNFCRKCGAELSPRNNLTS